MNEQNFTQPSHGSADNIPYFSVSEISGSIKRVLEESFGHVRVRGEITEFKQYSSGHMYFSLKDENGKLSAVIWRGLTSRLKLAPENGLEVIATGKISSYGERSSYQLMVEMLDYAGEGAILARIERLRLKLAEEGLFAEERKKAIPFLPSVIGVITSPQGAVLHDIKTTLARRFPRHVLVWPVAVQGEGAVGQIEAAIKGFDRIDGQEGIPRPDVLIIARGGGAVEDLMAFNDERVIRAVAECHIPVISAIGHETDVTLVDFAADRRAPTPTAAAEMSVPVYTELLADLAQKHARLAGGIGKTLQQFHLRLSRLEAALPDVSALLQGFRMRLDDRGHRLDQALPFLLERKRMALTRLESVFSISFQGLERYKNRVSLLQVHLDSAMKEHSQKLERRFRNCVLSPTFLQMAYQKSVSHLQMLSSLLQATSPQAVLARGYVVVKNAAGKTVTSTQGLRAGSKLVLVFADGEKNVSVQKDRQPDKQQDFGL